MMDSVSSPLEELKTQGLMCYRHVNAEQPKEVETKKKLVTEVCRNCPRQSTKQIKLTELPV